MRRFTILAIFGILLFSTGTFAATTQTGFQLASLDKESFLKTLGLKTGDVIVSVNGKAFDSHSTAKDLIDEIGKKNDGEIQILRLGKPKTLKFKVK